MKIKTITLFIGDTPDPDNRANYTVGQGGVLEIEELDSMGYPYIRIRRKIDGIDTVEMWVGIKYVATYGE